jgi:hypothetical protein
VRFLSFLFSLIILFFRSLFISFFRSALSRFLPCPPPTASPRFPMGGVRLPALCVAAFEHALKVQEEVCAFFFLSSFFYSPR